jgi:y4mF family transcriptional regulator
MNPKSLGLVVRRKRKRSRLRQAELASLADVGIRFVSELERGKPSLEIGRVMRVMNVLGLEFEVREKSWATVMEAEDGA